MGHTWEFSAGIWLTCTSWRTLAFLLIMLSCKVECDGKDNLTELVKIGNVDLPEGLRNKTNLKTLVIKKKTNLTELPKLERLTQLEVLVIKRNPNLTELPKLERLTKLEVLDVQQNSLSKAPPVQHLPNLLQLTLAYNPIPTLPKNYLKSNTNLTLFKATGIGLTHVPKDLFKTTTQMKWLHLDGNKIETLAEDMFWNLESLRTLNLARNQLSSLSVALFNHLGSLSELDLSSNHLNSSVVEILSSSPIRSNLKILKLSRNNLEKFYLTWLNSFPLMATFSLDQNNITANITMDQLAVVQKVTVNLKSNFKVRVILNGAFAKCDGDPRVELQLLETDLDEDCFKTKLTDDLKKVKRHCIEIPNSEKWKPGNRTCPFPYGDLIPDKCSRGCRCSFDVTSNESLVDCSNSSETVSFDSDIPHVRNKTSSIQLVLKGNGITDLESIFRGVKPPTLNKVRLLDLSENAISIVHPSDLPQNLTRLYLNKNRLSGVTDDMIDFFKNNLKEGVKLGGNKFACDCESGKLIDFLKTAYSKVLDTDDISFDCNPSEAFSAEGSQTEDRVCPKLGGNSLVTAVVLCLLLLVLLLVILRKKEMIRFRVSSRPRIIFFNLFNLIWSQVNSHPIMLRRYPEDWSLPYDIFISYSHHQV